MNFRLNLAVAFAAAMTFACADKQAAMPDLEEAMKAPPGAKVLGVYRMDITPVEGTNGTQFYMEAVPVSKTTTPLAGSVTVLGQFSALLATGAGPGACATSPSITAAPVVTNRTVDNLTNVWADVVSLPDPSLTACTFTPSTMSGDPPDLGTYFVPADANLGIWKYPNLAAAATPGGLGGAGTPIITSPNNPTGVWGFRFPGAGNGARFFFRIVANANTPRSLTQTAGPGTPITWTVPVAAGVVAGARLQVCSADMGLVATTQTNCPVAPLVNQLVVGGTFTPPAGWTNGATYWFRLRNDYGAPKGESTIWSEWLNFTYQNPVVTTMQPLTLAANVGAGNFTAYMNWTTVPAVPDTYFVLCSPSCPATATAVNTAGAVGVLVAAPVLGTNGAFTSPNIGANLVRDATGIYLSTVATYQARVYAYDGITVPLFTDAFTTAAITITPVATQPTLVSAPASLSILAATWPVTFTADPAFTGLLGIGTSVQVCVPDCINWPAAGGLTFQIPAFSATNSYTVDLKPSTLPAVIAGDTVEYILQNGDLAGRFPAAGPILSVVP